MRKIIKLISMLLAVLMVVGSLTVLFTLNVFAEDSATEEETTTTEDGSSTGGESEEEKPAERGDIDYITDVFATPEDKLATMDVAVEKDNYRLYVDKYSGEVACVNTLTGEKLFTNPYDAASATGNEDTKYDILSQLIVTFTDNEGQEKIFTSYKEAALRDQIVTEPIKNGVRVEYTIGRESSKVLVPRLISYERFEKMILAPLLETFGDELYNPRPQNPDLFDVQKILSYFIVYSKDKLDISKTQRKRMDSIYGGLYDNMGDAQYAKVLKSFPIVETLAVFAFDPDASEAELTKAEEIIKKYCPEYTYEELEYDHILTEYKSDADNPPVFRLALEYTIEDDGMSVRLPANGIRFNESLYTLSDITVLPYMGAGNSGYSGYNFFPDGSGTLFDFEQLNTNQTRSVIGKVYGTDFAYHEITGTYQKTIRYPVFGIVEDTTYYTYTEYDNDTDEIRKQTKISGAIVDAIKASERGQSVQACEGQTEALSLLYADIINGSSTIETKTTEKRGFVAIIEEGDALASISTYHSGALSDYNTIKMQFTPRPKDSYNLSDSISVGSNTEWTVVSDRKYVGNYRIRYILLSDTKKEENKGAYDASWFGMAVAYRDYLTDKGVITKKAASDVKTDIPLYIETFGAIETTQKILSIPVTVMAPLTTFENVIDIYKALSTQGMKNINFKLTGYANGGMEYTIPGNLKFENAVGGNDGFQDLLDYAESINSKNDDGNLGIFPDFDFAYNIYSEIFDGYNSYYHSAQTIDGRYASKKTYSATQQKYENYYEMVVSPAYFHEFYEKLKGNYLDKFNNVIGISVSTLGTALNSDFDEDEPYNREDSKEFTVEAFQHFDQNYGEVMTSGGNAYVWKYVDHILDVALDSSRYNFSSHAVPFVGVVLHGSVSFAGDPLNMEGDLQYAILKAIENGASPYFVLSYQNTQALKEDEQLSKYYSIRYDIWENDIIDVYDTLNGILGDVQDKYIINHEFLSGSRVPDSDELNADILNEYNAALEAEKNAAEILATEIAQAASIARENGRVAEAYAAEAVVKALDLYKTQMEYVSKATIFSSDFYANVKYAYGEYIKISHYSQYANSTDPAEKAKYEEYQRIVQMYNAVVSYNKRLEDCISVYDSAVENLSIYASGKDNEGFRKDLYAIYQAYAGGDMLYGQIGSTIALIATEKLLDDALADYVGGKITKAELDVVVEAYAVSKVDTTTFNNAVSSYLGGTLADTAAENARAALSSAKTALKNGSITEDKFNVIAEAYKNAIASYEAGTLNREAFNAMIEEWLSESSVDKAALDTAIAQYKAGTITAEALDAVISEYAIANLDKATIYAAVDAYDAANSALKIAENNNTLDKMDEDDYNDALAEFEEAKKTFSDCMSSYIQGESVNGILANNVSYIKIYWPAFQKALTEFNEAKAAYEVVEMTEDEAQSAYDDALAAFEEADDTFNEFVMGFVTENIDASELDAAIAEHESYADAYSMYIAANKAFNTLISSGFAVDYQECFDTYLLLEKLSRYSTWGKVATAADADPEAYECYMSYLAAVSAVAKLERNVEPEKYGTLDNYAVALAQLDVLTELGYDKSDDKAKLEQYEKALNLAKQARRSAITALAFTDANVLRDLKAILEAAQEHLVLATEAIDVLALSEGVTVKYAEGQPKSAKSITNLDEIDSFIVRQAIDRAMAVYNYVMADSYIEIVDGRDTEYTLNGYALKTNRDSANNTYYFYGTYEEGYSYFTRNSDGTFSVYHKGTFSGSKTPQGEEIYEYKEGNSKIYYTASVENGYTYYTKGTNDVYTVAMPTVYDGVKVATLDDGTVVYQDGNVYYSVNEDGTYTRYTYQKSIKSCVDEAVPAMEAAKESADKLVELSSDKTISDDVAARIERNYLMSIKGEETEEEEEDTNFKYSTGNIVVVTYGNDDGSAYKSVVLNYNNYTVRVVYDNIEYTIPAYSFVEINDIE